MNPKTPICILIAEDNPVDAQLVVRALRQAGFEPDWERVDNEPDFLARLRPGLHVILSDYQMPQFSGLRALTLVRASSLDIPFIVISGTIGEEQAVDAMRLGAADYLMKDRLGRLGEAVRNALHQSALHASRRAAKRALRENGEFIEDVLNSLPAEVVVLDETGRITAGNAGWKRFAQESHGSGCLGQNYLEVCARGVPRFGAADAARAGAGIRAVLEGDVAVFSMEYASHSATEERWFQLRASLLRGARPGVVLAHETITERKQAEASLRKMETEKDAAAEASRLKSQFLANMSHELRTPLNGILGYTELLREERPGPLNARQKEYLGDVYQSGQHLLQLINDVLDLAKIEAGKVELHLETFPLGPAIREVCAVVLGFAQKKQVSVNSTVAPALGEVTLDPQKLRQICYNLLSNAVKFTEPGGRVEIAAEPHGKGEFELRVTDTGIGIRAEDLPRLFREFEQLESGVARRFEGTGLGLALTKKLVERQGGRMAVRSEYGVGSVFTAVLPCRLAEG